MNKLILTAFALAISLGIKAQTYTPVAVTGYNADIVAEGTGAANTKTTHDVDGANYNLMAQGYTNTSNPAVTTTRGLPTGGLLTSIFPATPGLTFQLAPYTTSNSLRISSTGTGSLTFATPIAAEKVYVLATSGSGASTVTFTVNFSDATTQVFTQTVDDWYAGTTFVISGLGRVLRTTNAIDDNATAPRLYQYELALDAGNTAKTIQSITFNKTVTTGVLNVMGITVSSPLVLDAGLSAISSPVSPVMQNTSQPVQAILLNRGTSNLTSATITWDVDGIAQTNVPWTGNLAYNQTAAVALGNYTFPAGNHTVKARVINPNNTTDAAPYNDSTKVTLNVCNILAGTFTIDKTRAASASNFQSLGAAITAMTSCGISGPVTFNVVAGSGPYTEQIELPSINGASAANTITFNGNGDTIQANPVTGSRHVIKLNGADYVTITNFKILTTGTGTSDFGWGIHFTKGADNNTISNNILGIGSTSTAESNAVGIVFTNSGSTISTAANNGNNNIITGNTISGGYHGIVIYNQTTTANNNNITNNTIRDFYASGIRLYNTHTTLVEGNNISRSNRTPVTTFEGITMGTTTQGAIISKNRIFNTHGNATPLTGSAYGIYSLSDDAPASNANIVKNNLIYNFNNTGTVYGLYNSGSDGVYYYHNTVNLDNPANTGTNRAFYQTSTASDIRLFNNIFNIIAGATGAKHALYFGTTGSGIQSDNNILNVTGGASTSGIGSWGSVNKVAIADWRTASGEDSASVAANPLFTSVATGNFLPTATALNNSGKPVVPAVTDDITGALRNPLTPDPGAYEMGTFTPVANDAGVSAITSPVTGCNLTNQETITITVNNFGSAAISNIPVSYTINGGTAVNEIVAGPIAAGTTATYSFTAKADLSAPGSYSIVASTILVGDALATNDAFTKVVVSNAIPAVPTVTAGGATTFCSGGSVVLTAASTTTGATFTWFKDGTLISGATAATYTATTSGNYTAVASANTCSSAASTATTVTVNAAPAVPTITASGATSFCTGGSVNLTAASTTTGATFQWLLNGAPISGATAATFTANAAGTYTVTATANGCNATSAATTVTINSAPAVPTVTAGGATTICGGGSVTLTAASTTTGVTYQWFLNGVIIPGATAATHAATTTGSYTAVANLGGCSSAASTATAVTINPAPAVPTITAGGATTFCSGGSVALTGASTTTGATYAWFLNGTAITGATSATYTANASGNYTVVATAGGCSATSAATSVTVNPIAAVPTVTAGGPTTFCTGGSVVLTAASTTTGATYTWFLNGTVIPGATSATYTANASGNYTAVAAVGTCASAASAATTVTVNTAPAVPTLIAGGATTFCSGGSVVLTATSTTTGATYTWSLNGTAIPGATSATFTAAAAGSYTATATNGGCTATSTATTVTVNATPATPVITRLNMVLTSSAATGNQWFLDGVAITGATSQTHTVTANGNYTVVVTANGCPSAASNTENVTNTGLKADQVLKIAVYPNPSTGLFNLTLPEGKAYDLVVTDLTGKVVKVKTVKDQAAQLNLTGAAKGVYILKLTSEGKTAISKLVVE